jgi:hypothetical protein
LFNRVDTERTDREARADDERCEQHANGALQGVRANLVQHGGSPGVMFVAIAWTLDPYVAESVPTFSVLEGTSFRGVNTRDSAMPRATRS